jgi:hypothetical protein
MIQCEVPPANCGFRRFSRCATSHSTSHAGRSDGCHSLTRARKWVTCRQIRRNSQIVRSDHTWSLGSAGQVVLKASLTVACYQRCVTVNPPGHCPMALRRCLQFQLLHDRLVRLDGVGRAHDKNCRCRYWRTFSSDQETDESAPELLRRGRRGRRGPAAGEGLASRARHVRTSKGPAIV